MSTSDHILNLKDLQLPERPPVEFGRVREIIDSLGDSALRVWVLLKEPVSDEEQPWRRARPIEEKIREFLRTHRKHNRFSYFTFLTPTELAQESAV